MKLGTHVRLPDGREGTVVYNSIIGVGIKWGLHHPDPADFVGTDGNFHDMVGGHGSGMPDDWPWEPDALLRDPGLGFSGFTEDECVGEEYEVLS